jgi:hypothetical protein
MASTTIDLLFGVTGQSLYFDAPEGRPSSVTSSALYEATTADDGTAEAATTGSAAVQTDPRVCNVTATTGVTLGRSYLATSVANGEKEWIEAAAVVSGATVTAKRELQNAYTTSDTFVSTRITHAIDSTWVADTANLSGPFDPNARYRWRLVYVVASVTYVHDLYVDLLRYAGRHDVTPLDVDRRSRGWTERLEHSDREDQGRSVIDEAYQIVKFDLFNLDTPDQSVRNREVLNELVKLKAIEMIDMTEPAAANYQARLEQFIAWGKTHVQQSESGESGPGDTRPIWRR